MKIIQIGPVTPEYGGSFFGGVATHLTQLVETISKIGFETIVLSTTRKHIIRQQVNVVGMASLSTRFHFFINKPLSSILSLVKGGKVGYIKALYEYHIKSNYNPKETILHVHSLHCYFADNLLDDYNVIFTDHGFWQKKFNWGMLSERIKKSNRIISVSQYAKGRLTKTFPEAEEKTEVVYNPITPAENSHSNECERQYEKDVIFFNGYSESLKRKGLDLLLSESVRKLKNEKFEVVVDNEGRDYIARQGKLENLVVNGKLPYEKIIGIYKKSKLMVLPSRSESFGIVYIEAASYGVPVIGFKPVIEEFNEFLGVDIGLSFDPTKETASELLQKIEEAFSTNWNYEEIKSAVERKFSWDYISKDFVRIYKSSNLK
ncbi:glycosyltransferase family 4 protein [Vibrio vulnificus]|nr:glycosyltransferase family 4 protein [Vibrio vulnificus]ELS3556113.1 glycosyltransferase family 4 protein [Vibrio vulnificus]ELS9098780.1 glycosyltransferase family 4 protein [Vibrio vulnificus]